MQCVFCCSYVVCCCCSFCALFALPFAPLRATFRFADRLRCFRFVWFRFVSLFVAVVSLFHVASVSRLLVGFLVCSQDCLLIHLFTCLLGRGRNLARQQQQQQHDVDDPMDRRYGRRFAVEITIPIAKADGRPKIPILYFCAIAFADAIALTSATLT